MIRSVTNVRIRDKIAELRKLTKIGDIGWKIKKLKFGYTRHLVRVGDDKCGKRIEKWTTLENKRKRERPPPDTLEGRADKKTSGLLRHQTALDRKRWKWMVDTYAWR